MNLTHQIIGTKKKEKTVKTHYQAYELQQKKEKRKMAIELMDKSTRLGHSCYESYHQIIFFLKKEFVVIEDLVKVFPIK